MRVKTPGTHSMYAVNFPRLNGGLNLRELDYRLDADESPMVKNLWWQDGVLQSRDGQSFLSDSEAYGEGHTCFGELFWGNAFFHIGDALYYADPTGEHFALNRLIGDVPGERGTFFRYGDWLFYKNKGGFFRITYTADVENPFTATGVKEIAYTPVIQINSDPATGAGDLYQPENRISPQKTVWYTAVSGCKVYRLPVGEIDGIVSVTVDGTQTTAYTADLSAGTVTFDSAPPVTNPPTANTVRITYEKKNEEAERSVMDCEYATVAGGNANLCIILGGCDAQPNAVFWNSNDSVSMNPGYWPMSYYNLVGDTEDPVTGFGRQYSDLIVLSGHSVGKLIFDTQTVDDRESIAFAYQQINAKTGCDLPWSIQLIENNLVFCNTYQGVHMIRSSSSAYENNVECISLNVNGSGTELGLLCDVRSAGVVTSMDDDSRYWLCANGKVYLWDYQISSFSEPSWFYFTNVHGVAYFRDEEHRIYHLDGKGRVSRFVRNFVDYDPSVGIDKVYTFPTQNFGSYERLKNVSAILLSVRGDTDTESQLLYSTDHEKRFDLTPIRSFTYRLTPRNLSHRCLSYPKFAVVAKRRPGCRHIRHFAMTLSNSNPGEDLSIVSAQIFYHFQGRER
ncbi:MAG: hypothetical protein PUB51_00580 [Oscillospiraceae bacterium]|nr:hypothetical protein [Oscillospiraceae bacterium]